MNKTNPSKRSYHPFVLVAYYPNFLPTDILQSIPHSTLYDWKHKNVNALYGNSFFEDNQALFKTLEAVSQHKKLQTTVQVLLKIIALKKFIASNPQRLQINHRQIQKTVAGNIQKINQYIPLS